MPKLREVLLIDDNDADNFFHRRVVKKMGCTETVVTQPNGKAAIDYLTTKNAAGDYPRPDLVFLDINMPVMNGWDFLEAYDVLPPEQKAGVVVVMLTTSFNQDDRDRASKYGAVSHYLTKPLKPEGLTEVLERHFPDCLA